MLARLSLKGAQGGGQATAEGLSRVPLGIAVQNPRQRRRARREVLSQSVGLATAVVAGQTPVTEIDSARSAAFQIQIQTTSL